MPTERTSYRRRLAAVLLLGVAVSSAWGQALVKNPSFESNLNDESDPLSPGAPQGWPYYSPIDDWTSGGGGVNDLIYDDGGHRLAGHQWLGQDRSRGCG